MRRSATFNRVASACPLAKDQAARAPQSRKWTPLAVVLVALSLSRCSGAPPIRDYAREAKESLENLIENAEQGGVAAQVSLGLRYKHGMRVPQDSREALKWFLRASGQGNAFAQACLGAMYRDGLGVAQDYREAGKWFRKSADQGDSTAQLALGILYKEGKGVPRDDEEALKWLNSAMGRQACFSAGSLRLLEYPSDSAIPDYPNPDRRSPAAGRRVETQELGGVEEGGGETATLRRSAAFGAETSCLLGSHEPEAASREVAHRKSQAATFPCAVTALSGPVSNRSSEISIPERAFGGIRAERWRYPPGVRRSEGKGSLSSATAALRLVSRRVVVDLKVSHGLQSLGKRPA